MKLIKVKICGLREPENIRAVAELKPDFMGFIFHKPSPRYVGPDFKLPEKLDASIKKVGVFVNESASAVKKLASQIGLDTIQLHGDETPEIANELRAEGLTVIKVLRVDDSIMLDELQAFHNSVDYFLFDTRGALYGGNAKKFHWGILNDYQLDIPFFLSGGLTPSDVAGAVHLNLPQLFALDMNSGVEEAPGKKDINKVNATISNIRKTIHKTA